MDAFELEYDLHLITIRNMHLRIYSGNIGSYFAIKTT